MPRRSHNGLCKAEAPVQGQALRRPSGQVRYCKKTCDRCGLASTTVACFDAVSECEAWKTNGFCNSTLYPDSEKKKYCASTCGLC
ncbi:unnamed protein product [Nippostrongylus brasiliensis]|uniref:ShKT domain-containing protein n=1 Tax=Nippostrongylus brasiliensis TaxID=27835 RepID=A0A0N4YPK9_NIPBR|nr:unnamed protein product [Nippostrongylus brasiliensis]